MIKKIYRFLNPKFQHFFLEYKVDVKPRYGYGKPAHPALMAIIEKNRPHYQALIYRILLFKENIWTIKEQAPGKDSVAPGWNNGFLPGLDMISIYSILAIYQPKKFIEIGSGNSTKIAHKVKQEQNLSTEIISIDPIPRAEIDVLANRIIREPLENIDLSIFNELEENDVLFIDNAHRILPNSDSMVFYLEILPRLKKGVIVHIHDVYLPYDYPQFMCDRLYSEQYGLAMYLLANSTKYETLLPNYFIFMDKELSEMISPIWEHANMKNVERHGGSFWLKICE